MKKTLFPGLIVLLIAPFGVAQTFKVVPKGYEKLEGYSSHTYPWSFKEVHFQQLWYGKEIANSVAVINGIWYRNDGKATSSYAGKTYKCDITLYVTSVTPRGMSKTWAANRGSGTGKVVFKGTLNIPSVNPPSKPTDVPCPWAFKVPFSTPYTYQVSKGNLLMELYQRDAYSRSTWSVDALRQAFASGGHVGYIGLGCRGNNSEYTRAYIDSKFLMTSGSIDAKVYFSKNAVSGARAWIGFSRTRFGSINLPFDLSAFGAKGCYLYCDIYDVQYAPTYGYHVKWPIPNLNFLVGYQLYFQTMGIAKNANPLGAIFSEGYFMRIGSGPMVPGVTHSVYRWKNLNSTTGYMSPIYFYAPIVRFDGVFH